MAEIKCEAVILFTRDWGARDRLAALFTKEFGKLTVMAYGARYAKSSFGSLQPFAYAAVTFQQGKNVDRVKQYDIIRSFRELREDLCRMAYSSFVAELVSELWPDRQTDLPVFELLLNSFRLMGERNPRLVSLASAWQLINIAGLQPEFSCCVRCGCSLSYSAGFDIMAGGTVCRTCLNLKGEKDRQIRSDCVLKFTGSDKEFLEFILRLDWQSPGEYKVSGATLINVEKLLLQFIRCNIDKQLKSIDFISKL